MGVLKLGKKNIIDNKAKNEISDFKSLKRTTKSLTKRDLKSKFNIVDEAFTEELKDKRELNSFVYSRNDGTCRKIVSGCPLFYRSEDNELNEISNSLEDNGYEIVNRYNSFRVKFDKSAHNDKIFELCNGDKTVVLRSEIKNSSNSKVCGCKCEKAAESENIVYASLADGTKIEYVVLNDRIKENIVIEKKRENYEYMFSLEIGDMVVQEAEHSRILLKNPVTGETKFIIPAPIMFDAAKQYSDDVSYEVDICEGKMHIKVIADADFINAENRVFPVIIDPQIVMQEGLSWGTVEINPQDYSQRQLPGILELYISSTMWRFCFVNFTKPQNIMEGGNYKDKPGFDVY